MTNNKEFITSKLLPLTNDMVFKAVYGSNTKASNAALIALLNRILQKDEDPIVWLHCENPFRYRMHPIEKETIMDIKVRLSSGELLDLEMQVHHLSDYINRSVFYMGKLVNESLEIGEDYDKMRGSIVISIVDGILFPDYEKVFSSFYLKERENHHKLTDIAQIHFLELGKIDITSKDISEMTPHERLGAYFKHAADESLSEFVEQLLDYEKGVLDLTKPILEEISEEKRMREIAIAHEMWLHDVATMKARARKDGLAEGRAEGRAEGLIEGESIGANKMTISLICKKLSKGKSLEIIAEELEEEISAIEPICKIAERFAPEFDIEQIYTELNK